MYNRKLILIVSLISLMVGCGTNEMNNGLRSYISYNKKSKTLMIASAESVINVWDYKESGLRFKVLQKKNEIIWIEERDGAKDSFKLSSYNIDGGGKDLIFPDYLKKEIINDVTFLVADDNTKNRFINSFSINSSIPRESYTSYIKETLTLLNENENIKSYVHASICKHLYFIRYIVKGSIPIVSYSIMYIQGNSMIDLAISTSLINEDVLGVVFSIILDWNFPKMFGDLISCG